MQGLQGLDFNLHVLALVSNQKYRHVLSSASHATRLTADRPLVYKDQKAYDSRVPS